MSIILLGSLLIIAGLVFMAAQPIWRGRLSGRQGEPATTAGPTLEPRRPATGFRLRSNWPGLALVSAGVLLLILSGLWI